MSERLHEQQASTMVVAKMRGVAGIVTLALGSHGRGFTDYTLSPDSGLALDPFLVLSDFQMPQPFFPPHPHAGFSVMTFGNPPQAAAL